MSDGYIPHTIFDLWFVFMFSKFYRLQRNLYHINKPMMNHERSSINPNLIKIPAPYRLPTGSRRGAIENRHLHHKIWWAIYISTRTYSSSQNERLWQTHNNLIYTNRITEKIAVLFISILLDQEILHRLILLHIRHKISSMIDYEHLYSNHVFHIVGKR